MKFRFTKMHGLGNDYVYVNAATESLPTDLNALSKEISDRHCGIGSDGLVLITPSEEADFGMRMFKADGTEGKMCGNATRCIGKFVYEKGLTDKTNITLSTLAGIKHLKLTVVNGRVEQVLVDMGKPEFSPEQIPVIASDKLIETPLATSKGEVKITTVSMGNPHCVVFVQSLADVDVHGLGKEIENNPIFPERANVEFVEVLDDSHVKMRVWERGSGETQACGTGACAVAVAAAVTGRCKRKCTVTLLGGDLVIEWRDSDGHVLMAGGATTVFEGEYVF